MPLDRKRLLGYVETIQLILGVTDKRYYKGRISEIILNMNQWLNLQIFLSTTLLDIIFGRAFELFW